MNKCFICGGPVVWQSDFDYEDYCYEGDGIVSVYQCFEEKCNAYYEISIPLGDNNGND